MNWKARIIKILHPGLEDTIVKNGSVDFTPHSNARNPKWHNPYQTWEELGFWTCLPSITFLLSRWSDSSVSGQTECRVEPKKWYCCLFKIVVNQIQAPVAKGNIWTETEGGKARLCSHPAHDTAPHFTISQKHNFRFFFFLFNMYFSFCTPIALMCLSTASHQQTSIAK